MGGVVKGRIALGAATPGEPEQVPHEKRSREGQPLNLPAAPSAQQQPAGHPAAAQHRRRGVVADEPLLSPPHPFQIVNPISIPSLHDDQPKVRGDLLGQEEYSEDTPRAQRRKRCGWEPKPPPPGKRPLPKHFQPDRRHREDGERGEKDQPVVGHHVEAGQAQECHTARDIKAPTQ